MKNNLEDIVYSIVDSYDGPGASSESIHRLRVALDLAFHEGWMANTRGEVQSPYMSHALSGSE